MKTAYVYLIGPDDGPYKIGHCTNISMRLTSLQCGNWQELKVQHSITVPMFTAVSAERVMHTRFKDHRIRGEWFDAKLDTLVRQLNAVAIEAFDADAANDSFHQNSCVQLCKDPRRTWGVLCAYRNLSRDLMGKKYIEQLNATLMKCVGQSAYVVFQVAVIENRDLTSRFHEKPHLARQAERSLVEALDMLTVLWDRTEPRRRALDKYRRMAA